MAKLVKNWNKQNAEHYKPTEDHISRMSKAMDELCEMLAEDSGAFSKEAFFEKFSSYIENGRNRLLYTSVTNAIFDNYGATGTFLSNLEDVIAFSYEHIPADIQKKREHEKIQRALMKLWDHVNLAIRQYELFNQNDERYEKIVEAKMKDVEIRLTKEMNTQLISLIAIFTALSFIVFGGISSLDNIFDGVKDIPVTKLMIVGSIWCFCIMNLVFVFMFFVGKLTHLEIGSTKDLDANLVQKYPLIWWCNWTVIAVLLLSAWAYYLKCEGFSKEAYILLSKYPTIYSILGTVIIVLFILYGGLKLYRLSQKK